MGRLKTFCVLLSLSSLVAAIPFPDPYPEEYGLGWGYNNFANPQNHYGQLPQYRNQDAYQPTGPLYGGNYGLPGNVAANYPGFLNQKPLTQQRPNYLPTAQQIQGQIEQQLKEQHAPLIPTLPSQRRPQTIEPKLNLHSTGARSQPLQRGQNYLPTAQQIQQQIEQKIKEQAILASTPQAAIVYQQLPEHNTPSHEWESAPKYERDTTTQAHEVSYSTSEPVPQQDNPYKEIYHHIVQNQSPSVGSKPPPIWQNLWKKYSNSAAPPQHEKRFLVIHPDGSTEFVDKIETIAQKHPNYLLVNGGSIGPNGAFTPPKPNQSESNADNVARSPLTSPISGVEPINPVQTPGVTAKPVGPAVQGASPAVPVPVNVVPTSSTVPASLVPDTSALNPTDFLFPETPESSPLASSSPVLTTSIDQTSNPMISGAPAPISPDSIPICLDSPKPEGSNPTAPGSPTLSSNDAAPETPAPIPASKLMNSGMPVPDNPASKPTAPDSPMPKGSNPTAPSSPTPSLNDAFSGTPISISASNPMNSGSSNPETQASNPIAPDSLMPEESNPTPNSLTPSSNDAAPETPATTTTSNSITSDSPIPETQASNPTSPDKPLPEGSNPTPDSSTPSLNDSVPETPAPTTASNSMTSDSSIPETPVSNPTAPDLLMPEGLNPTVLGSQTLYSNDAAPETPALIPASNPTTSSSPVSETPVSYPSAPDSVVPEGSNPTVSGSPIPSSNDAAPETPAHTTALNSMISDSPIPETQASNPTSPDKPIPEGSNPTPDSLTPSSNDAVPETPAPTTASNSMTSDSFIPETPVSNPTAPDLSMPEGLNPTVPGSQTLYSNDAAPETPALIPASNPTTSSSPVSETPVSYPSAPDSVVPEGSNPTVSGSPIPSSNDAAPETPALIPVTTSSSPSSEIPVSNPTAPDSSMSEGANPTAPGYLNLSSNDAAPETSVPIPASIPMTSSSLVPETPASNPTMSDSTLSEGSNQNTSPSPTSPCSPLPATPEFISTTPTVNPEVPTALDNPANPEKSTISGEPCSTDTIPVESFSLDSNLSVIDSEILKKIFGDDLGSAVVHFYYVSPQPVIKTVVTQKLLSNGSIWEETTVTKQDSENSPPVVIKAVKIL